MKKPRKITILGSTGSVGESTLSLLDFAAARGESEVEIEALTANRNVQ
ncbi:MAG: 1-deoxy-D-xylulose-5-phosphate reductoisomerase, partial [Marinicaulis sp.]|nr:1-deoxy-D-xylulose-5-phosphate reductoisomerase [Marinicaulis sp.]